MHTRPPTTWACPHRTEAAAINFFATLQGLLQRIVSAFCDRTITNAARMPVYPTLCLASGSPRKTTMHTAVHEMLSRIECVVVDARRAMPSLEVGSFQLTFSLHSVGSQQRCPRSPCTKTAAFRRRTTASQFQRVCRPSICTSCCKCRGFAALSILP